MAETVPPRLQMGQMITGYWVSKAVYVAAKLGLADLLADGPKSVSVLASETGADERALYRLLRALASVGVFCGRADGTYEQTPLSATLRSGADGMRAFAIMAGESLYEAWGDLFHSVTTGEVAFEKRFGMPFFEHLSRAPEESARVFDEAMTQIHGHETPAMLAAYDFSDCRTVADVGGGNGSVLTAILERHSNTRGLLFDLPHVIERAATEMAARGLAERCCTVAGSFFEHVPEGADCYLMRHIIHDWNDEQCRTILGHCRRAIPADGRLLVVEAVIPEGNGFFFEKLLDLNMMAVPGGLERTEREYADLLASADFTLRRVVPTEASISVIEAVPRL